MHFDTHSDELSRVTVELGLERLRGRTESLAAAVTRLRADTDEVGRDATNRQEMAERLRDLGDPSASRLATTEARLNGQRTRDGLATLAAQARALAGDAEKVGRTAEQNVELLRGTDLGYEAREASAVVGAFARELLDAATDPSRYEPFDAERISRLVDMLDAALSGLGQDYAPHAESHRRLRRRS